nr:hypothetical protein Iba_chr02aCG13190 [Ipomoea batatas]
MGERRAVVVAVPFKTGIQNSYYLRSARKFSSPRIDEKPLGIAEPMAIITEDEWESFVEVEKRTMVLAIRLEAESVIRLGIDEVREFAKKIVRFVVGQDSVGRSVQGHLFSGRVVQEVKDGKTKMRITSRSYARNSYGNDNVFSLLVGQGLNSLCRPEPHVFFWDRSNPTVLYGWPRLVGAMREEISTSCTYCALTPPRSVLHLLPRLGEASRLINKGSTVELMVNRTSPSG